MPRASRFLTFICRPVSSVLSGGNKAGRIPKSYCQEWRVLAFFTPKSNIISAEMTNYNASMISCLMNISLNKDKIKLQLIYMLRHLVAIQSSIHVSKTLMISYNSQPFGCTIRTLFSLASWYTRLSVSSSVLFTRLLNDAGSSSDYIASNVWMIKWMINWKGCERNLLWPISRVHPIIHL
jgi:hypothetical protein